MNQVTYLLNNTLEGLNVPPDVKNVLLNTYFILYYKALLEVLLSLKAKDEEFLKQVIGLFNKGVESLDKETKKNLENLMEEQKGKLLAEVVGAFKNQLPEDISAKIEANVSQLEQKSPQ